LAGGGFRASLFHLGVLWRMAELDLLRYVEVLSTVSGGSIIGALYALLLKRDLDRQGSLSRNQYVSLVQELCERLVRGIQQNLRTRLFWSPLALLRMILTPYGMAHHMGRLYDRHLYRGILPGAAEETPLRDLLIKPAGQKIADLEAYNAAPFDAARPYSRVPRLILNATTLNSGGPFQFTSVELGDPRLGFFRLDEVETELLPRKRARTRAAGIESAMPDSLARCEIGLLRRAKIAAWYHQRGAAEGVTGGKTPAEHVAEFAAAIAAIDMALEPAQDPAPTELMDLVLETYYRRSAVAVNTKAAKTMTELTVADAVAASACFPPVFPPFRLDNFYDPDFVDLVGLTDGGVYDNMGITTLLQEGCTQIIASDTGGVFNAREPTTSGRIGMVGRISSILMNAVAEQQRGSLRERNRVTDELQDARCEPPLAELRARYQVQELAYFHINSPPLNPARAENQEILSRLRTDLDAFGDVEAAALINHGYETADEYVNAFFKGNKAYPIPAMPLTPPVALDLKARERRILQIGRYSFFRALRLNALPTILVTLLFITLVSTDAAFSWSGLRHVTGWLDRSVLFALRWISDGLRLFWAALNSVAKAGIVAGGLLLVIGSLMAVAGRADRRASPITRWIRRWGGNGLWLLGLAPIWIAVVGSVSAWISYWCNGRPFLGKTKLANRPW
jgi:predicted acylesterase/phospholipase RssA